MKEELAPHATLRGRQREQMKVAEEEKQRIKETLRKSQANTDWMKEEREKLLQKKNKHRRIDEA